MDESSRAILSCNGRYRELANTGDDASNTRWPGPSPEAAIDGLTHAWPRPDGRTCLTRVRASRWLEPGATRAAAWLLVLEDITDSHDAQETLRREYERLSLAISSASLATWDWNIVSGEVRYSDRWAELRGYRPEEIVPNVDTWQNSVHPEDLPQVMAEVERHFRGETEYYAAEHRTRTKSGGWRWIDDRGRVVARDASGRPLRMTGTELDITSRKEAEQALIVSERRLATLMANLPGMAYRCRNEPNWPIDFASDGILQLCGVHPDELKRAPLAFNDLIDPADQPRVWAEVQAALARKERYRVEYKIRSRNGEQKWVWEQGCGVFDEHGQLVALEGFIADVTERKRAAAIVLEWKTRYETAALASGQLLYDWNPTEDTVEFAGAAKQIIGYDVAELNGRLAHWTDLVHPDDRERFCQECARVQSTGGNFGLIYRIRRKSGEYVTVEDTGAFVSSIAGARMIGFVRDISDRIRAEETRQRLEEQLRQSQKLEAIGQLSGGIAHDFNNLLTVVLGHVGFLRQEINLSQQGHGSVLEIERSAERAANLTHQLLAFSRRQNMRCAAVDLNQVVASAAAMLGRLVGEPTRIDVRCSAEPLIVEADAMMLEQVLLNLAVNGRDAMSEGGTLTIETFAIEIRAADLARLPQARPGRAAALRVSDHGRGIAPEDLPHIFEPFFTTKDVGKGTGLGLATVYGIVQQHRGWITVESKLGEGSTFSVYLPRLASAPTPSAKEAEKPALPGQGEGVLLVEDEEPVRLLLAELLRRNGFTVFEAQSGPDALKVWAEQARNVHVLVTDLVMPDGMSGRVLAEKLCATAPTLSVIYMSGYSPEFAARNVDLRPGVNFIAKPSDLPKLLSAIQQALGRGGA